MRKILLTFLTLFALPTYAEIFDAHWLETWQNPPESCRPLQIIHGYFGPEEQLREKMSYFHRDCGLGGIVCNFQHEGYLENEDGWKIFTAAVRAARDEGLRVWIYDEDGYPSPAAGGRVLQDHPEFEAQELVFDSENLENPFQVRACYEFTHATNNYCAIRRYPNVFQPAAMQRFLEVTHQRYAEHLGPNLAGVEAFFTDEPSSNGVNTGIIDGITVRTQDVPDAQKKNLPMVPWCDDFPSEYQKRYGEDLLTQRRSLFQGDSPEDRRIREQFWKMVAERYDASFMKSVQDWCQAHGVASSGHALHEEALAYHVPCYGNHFAGTRCMDIPGVDLLNSRPEAARYVWRTLVYAASVSAANGTRRIMTEISDFSDRMATPPGFAPLENMCSVAAAQAAWGATDFTLYYRIEDRGPADHARYCEFTGRLNAVLLDAQVVPETVIYYPIRDLQREYRPVKERLSESSQTPRHQKIVDEYYRFGDFLTRTQRPFLAADSDMLERAEIRKSESGAPRLVLGTADALETLLLPRDVELTPACESKIQEFERQGGRVLRGYEEEKLQTLPQNWTSANDQQILGHFRRDGYEIFLISHFDRENGVSGTFRAPAGCESCKILRPALGTVTEVPVVDSVVTISMSALETVLLVF